MSHYGRHFITHCVLSSFNVTMHNVHVCVFMRVLITLFTNTGHAMEIMLTHANHANAKPNTDLDL